MALALEMLIFPILLMLAILVLGVVGNFSAGAIILTLFLVALVSGALIALMRFGWRVEEDEGIHGEDGSDEPHSVSERGLEGAAIAMVKRRRAESDSEQQDELAASGGEAEPQGVEPAPWALGGQGGARTRSEPRTPRH